jgi:hypothetical protein
VAIPSSIIGICALNFAIVGPESLCAFTAAFAVVKQSSVSHVSLVLDTSGFFAHLYVTLPTLVVDPDFVHATPFETLVAACAGTATMTPPATMSATENDAILRNIENLSS